jgi:DNA polymerase-1
MENKLTVYGAELIIDPKEYSFAEIIVVDIETDERDNFVGIGICDSADRVYYFSRLDSTLIERIERCRIVGHNVKFDVKLLSKWGCNIRPEQLLFDTMLASYVIDTTRESHGLKDLAKDLLKREYPSYKAIVGKGKKKITLDKQPIEVVSAYCGADVRCTWDLWKYFESRINPIQRRVLDNLDMPLMRLLYEMEQYGIAVDREYLEELREKFASLSAAKEALLLSEGLENPRSPKQVLEWLNGQGVRVESTDKRVLQFHADKPPVKMLLDYRETHKLLTTYAMPLLTLSEADGRIHTSFNQVTYEQSDDQWKGIRTGRLSSSEPNLQNIPARSDAGKVVRRAFVPDAGFGLICADFEQIEYRLLAHFAEDQLLIQAFRDGKDVHEETGRAIGGDRKLGKNINFAAIYGAGPDKVASMCKISKEDAKRFLADYWAKLPKVKRWVEEVKKNAYHEQGVRTWYGRWIPLPGIRSYNEMEKWHWERASVNYIIQGSAAEILKLAMLRCKESGYTPLLTVHDELLFNCAPEDAEATKKKIGELMSGVCDLKIPIIAKVGYGTNWEAAK